VGHCTIAQDVGGFSSFDTALLSSESRAIDMSEMMLILSLQLPKSLDSLSPFGTCTLEKDSRFKEGTRTLRERTLEVDNRW